MRCDSFTPKQVPVTSQTFQINAADWHRQKSTIPVSERRYCISFVVPQKTQERGASVRKPPLARRGELLDFGKLIFDLLNVAFVHAAKFGTFNAPLTGDRLLQLFVGDSKDGIVGCHGGPYSVISADDLLKPLGNSKTQHVIEFAAGPKMRRTDATIVMRLTAPLNGVSGALKYWLAWCRTLHTSKRGKS